MAPIVKPIARCRATGALLAARRLVLVDLPHCPAQELHLLFYVAAGLADNEVQAQARTLRRWQSRFETVADEA
jgi:hypothetical protein